MASNATTFATEPPPATQPAASAAPPSTISSPDEAVRLLKRPRSLSPSSPRSLAQQLLPLSSPTKAARLSLATASASATPLTGAAALEDDRRRREEEQGDERARSPPATSDNPGHRVISSLLLGSSQAMSRASDAPQTAPTAAMEPVTKAPNPVAIPPTASVAMDRGETSPQSTTSVSGAPVTESPTPMDVDNKVDHAASSQQVVGQDERLQPGSLSYPGSLQSTGSLTDAPTRGMSFPMPPCPNSSSGKKHKCPYCNTEFTRHHNLNSHLLTHSQEKPYVCTDCQMRFRRLHDLKRHGRLHTGEKPHICLKCDRKFARGDALARHSKGAGGCAGRRSSMGSFADGDELENSLAEADDAGMSGLTYDHGGDEDELRRQSMPNQHVTGVQGEGYVAHARTFPPAGPRPGTSGLYPPNVNQNQANTGTSPSIPGSLASNHTPNTSVSSIPVSGGTNAMYAQAGMTESPKPLSPGVQGHDTTGAGRQRSPSLSQQLQQQQFGRRQSELQSPHSGQPRPKLPGLSHPGGFVASGSANNFSHNRNGSGSQQQVNDSGNMFAQSDPSVMWAYIQTMEEKVKTLSDKVVSLEHVVTDLRKQIDTRDATANA